MPPPRRRCGRRCPPPASRIASCWAASSGGAIPAYANVTEAEFLDHKWQAKHSITNIGKLLAALAGLVSEDFIDDAQRGFERAPMSVRVSPYLLSLIDWTRPRTSDPLRLQFIPLALALAARITRSSTSIRCTSARTCPCPG